MRVIASGMLGLALLAGCSGDSSDPAPPSSQRPAVAGLSIVEEFPATPTQVTLAPNAALIDGDTSASAAVDVGYGPAVGGDLRLRDVGIQFPDATTEVNLLRVWLDRTLPPDVFAAYGWWVHRSDDNATWNPVPLVLPPALDPSSRCAELWIPATTARYLKAVTPPLAPGVTSDARYADVFVTELQAFLVPPPG